MKKIITSVGMIIFAGALIAGATGAFFSDTETSTGNVFTAGAIDLKVDSQQHYNNAICVLNPVTTQVTTDYYWQLEAGATTTPAQYPVIGSPCDGTWSLTDLGGISHKFFNFGDVKPGDQGENTISLHIDSNPAYACADVTITSNDDVSTVEPEIEAGDATNTPSTTDGELAQNLEFTAWLDNASTSGAVPGDNIHQAGEVLYFAPGPASSVLAGGSLTLADNTTAPLPGGSTSYIGLAWCAGDMTATTGGGAPTCNGAAMGNIAQTDSMTADLTFRVEQARNNPNFTCGDGEVVAPEWTETGTRTGGDVETVADETATLGNNVLKLTTINDTDSRVRYNHAESMNVADVDGLSYDSKQVSAIDAVNGNATFRIVVDLDGNLLTLGDVTDVTFEPYYNIQAHNSLNDAGITTGAWQNWAATRALGKFWAAGVTTSFGVSEGAGGAYATNFTLDALTAAYPNAKVVGINIGMGTYNVGQVVYVDNLIFDGVLKGFE